MMREELDDKTDEIEPSIVSREGGRKEAPLIKKKTLNFWSKKGLFWDLGLGFGFGDDEC